MAEEYKVADAYVALGVRGDIEADLKKGQVAAKDFQGDLDKVKRANEDAAAAIKRRLDLEAAAQNEWRSKVIPAHELPEARLRARLGAEGAAERRKLGIDEVSVFQLRRTGEDPGNRHIIGPAHDVMEYKKSRAGGFAPEMHSEAATKLREARKETEALASFYQTDAGRTSMRKMVEDERAALAAQKRIQWLKTEAEVGKFGAAMKRGGESLTEFKNNLGPIAGLMGFKGVGMLAGGGVLVGSAMLAHKNYQDSMDAGRVAFPTLKLQEEMAERDRLGAIGRRQGGIYAREVWLKRQAADAAMDDSWWVNKVKSVGAEGWQSFKEGISDLLGEKDAARRVRAKGQSSVGAGGNTLLGQFMSGDDLWRGMQEASLQSPWQNVTPQMRLNNVAGEIAATAMSGDRDELKEIAKEIVEIMRNAQQQGGVGGNVK